MTKKTRRLYLAIGIVVFAAAAVGLTLTALKQSLTYFYMPSDVAALAERPATTIRLGGLVETGSVNYPKADDAAPEITFNVTDGEQTIAVSYAGILPDLFREGQGVIVQGRFAPDGSLKADNVLAKHDENYMPKEVADALKEKGVWQQEGPAAQ